MINWSAVAAIISAVGLLITIGVGVFWGGRLTQKTLDNEIKLDSHSQRLDGIDGRINGIDVSVGRLHEWKDGFNAGARKLGTNEARD